MSELVVDLETPLPAELNIGKGNALFLRGRCYHPDEALKRVVVTIDGSPFAVKHHSLAAPEVLDGTVKVDTKGHVLLSKFWTHIPIGPIEHERTVAVGIEATLRSGTKARRDLGNVSLRDRHVDPAPVQARRAVCIATSDPDPGEIRRAIAPDTVVIVADDHSPRTKHDELVALGVRVIRTERRVGPLRALELALLNVPEGIAEVVVGDHTFSASLLSDVLPFPPDAGAFDAREWIQSVAGGSRRRHAAPHVPRSRAALVATARESSTVASFELAQDDVNAAVLKMRTGRSVTRRASVGALSAVAMMRLLTVAFRVRGARLIERRASVAEQTPSLQAQLAKIEHDMAPMRLSVVPEATARLNVVVPMIDFRYVFGAYLTIFHLLVALHRRGVQSRLVIVQERPIDPVRWRSELQRYPGLEDLLDLVEIVDLTDRSNELEVSPSDAFLATTSWTAHVASSAAKELGRDRFAFLVLEYDPLVHPVGSVHELSAAAYDLPHDAIFSTNLLRRYFEANTLGVFKHGGSSVAVDNPIDEHDLNVTNRKRLLLYARPEAHAARNLFEIAVLALRRVAPMLAGWQIDGIGSLQPFELDLGGGRTLNVLQRAPLDRYLESLETYDVGIALQATPHPGLVALDMAAAGIVTVTNTFATKRATDLTEISDNLVVAEPTIESVAQAIETAVGRADNTQARIDGANLRWPRAWDEALRIEAILALGAMRLS